MLRLDKCITRDILTGATLQKHILASTQFPVLSLNSTKEHLCSVQLLTPFFNLNCHQVVRQFYSHLQQI